MTAISAQELAELVPCPLEDVSRLHELGILGPHEQDGQFSPAAVHVVRLMAAFEDAGISLDDVARGVTAGELSFPLGLFMPEPVELSETYEELGARLDRSPELLRRLSGELGLPPPAHGRIRAEDAEMLTLLVTRLDLVDENELSRFARLYGGAVQRLVTAGLQFFDQAVRQRVSRLELSNEEKDRLGFAKAAGFTELVGNLCGLELIEQTEKSLAVPARIGINAGAVIAQEGDYFGRTVNVAARIADYARPHEVLVSDEAKRSSSVPDVAFELVGDVPLKGVSESVRLHRATRG